MTDVAREAVAAGKATLESSLLFDNPAVCDTGSRFGRAGRCFLQAAGMEARLVGRGSGDTMAFRRHHAKSESTGSLGILPNSMGGAGFEPATSTV